MVFLSPPNSSGLALSTFQARTNPPLTRALACCCDGAATESLLRQSCADPVALILRVASLGRDAQNEEASIHFPP